MSRPETVRCQSTDVVWCRERHAVLKTAQGVHCVAFEVHYLKYRLEKKAGEHTRRDDYPFSFVLGTKQLAHIELSIE